MKTFVTLRTNILLTLNITNGNQPSNDVVARSVDFLTRHVRQFGKLFRRMQQLNCLKFVALNGCGEMVLFYWSQVEQATDSPVEYLAGMCFEITKPISRMLIYGQKIHNMPYILFDLSFRLWQYSKKASVNGVSRKKEAIPTRVSRIVLHTYFLCISYLLTLL